MKNKLPITNENDWDVLTEEKHGITQHYRYNGNEDKIEFYIIDGMGHHHYYKIRHNDSMFITLQYEGIRIIWE